MRILIYSPDAGTRPGHSFIYAARICQCLAHRGQEIALLTTPGFVAQYRKMYRGNPPFTVIEKTKCDFSRTLVPAATLQMVRYMWYRVKYGVRMLYELKKVLKTSEFTILHWLDNPEMITTMCFGLAFRFLNRHRKSTRWFLNIHPADLSFKTGGRNLLRRLYKGFAGWALRFLVNHDFVMAVFVHGEWIQRKILANWKFKQAYSKVIVAPYGVDNPMKLLHTDREGVRQKLGIPGDAMVALSFGMIRPDKRIRDIIRAVALIPDVMLLIAGMPVDMHQQEIRQWIVEAGIAERSVLRLEYIPEEEIGLFFAAANVVLLAHDKSFAGQSGPLHLACSYLIPIIASDVGDIGRFVHENGVGEVFPPRDWEALAKLLGYFQTIDKAAYRRYVQREREIVAKLSWENTVERYLEAYTLEKG